MHTHKRATKHYPNKCTRWVGLKSLSGCGLCTSGPPTSLGSIDYFIESALIQNREFASRWEQIPDDFRTHAYTAQTSYDYNSPGARICRGDFPPEFSALVKFSLRDVRSAFTFLNVSTPNGTQFALTLDACSNTLNVTLPSSCPIYRIQLPYSRDRIRAGRWHKLAISITPTTLELYVDCELEQFVNLQELYGVDLSTCTIQCDDDTTVGVLQPAETDTCSGARSVSISNMLFCTSISFKCLRLKL